MPDQMLISSSLWYHFHPSGRLNDCMVFDPHVKNASQLSIRLQSCLNTGDNALWQLDLDDDGYYNIHVKGASKEDGQLGFKHVTPSYLVAAVGVPVDRANKYWKLVWTGSDTFKLISFGSSGFTLTYTRGNETTQSIFVQRYAEIGSSLSDWVLEVVDSSNQLVPTTLVSVNVTTIVASSPMPTSAAISPVSETPVSSLSTQIMLGSVVTMRVAGIKAPAVPLASAATSPSGNAPPLNIILPSILAPLLMIFLAYYFLCWRLRRKQQEQGQPPALAMDLPASDPEQGGNNGTLEAQATFPSIIDHGSTPDNSPVFMPVQVPVISGHNVDDQSVDTLTSSKPRPERLSRQQYRPEVILMDQNGKYVVAVAILDTGSHSGNWVSTHLVQQVGKYEDIDTNFEAPRTRGMDGKLIRARGVVMLQFRFHDDNKFHRCRFYVVDNPDVEMVIGRDDVIALRDSRGDESVTLGAIKANKVTDAEEAAAEIRKKEQQKEKEEKARRKQIKQEEEQRKAKSQGSSSRSGSSR